MSDITEQLANALQKLLPMQGCAVCQNSWDYCRQHGEIRKAVAEAEAALAAHGRLVEVRP